MSKLPANSDPARAVGDLQTILDISRQLVATEDLDALLELIIERALSLLDAERATVFLYDEGAGELISRIAAGEREIRVPADRGISGETIRCRCTINVPDAYADERFNPEIDRRTGFHTRNILSVPLCDYAGRLVGVLQVLNRRSGPFGEYEQSLAEALAAQAGVALQRAKLLEHFLEKQQMERAMAIARDIQQGLLPRELPELPGYEVSGLSLPADQTGGDTYDLLGAEGQRLMMTVADATGHGIGPALVISTTRAMLRAVSLGERNVAAILRTVNDLLCEDLTDGRFVTCFLAELESRTHRLRFASAGHGPILLYRRGEDRFDEPPAAGPPLGVLGGIDFGEEGCCTLERGDFLAVTTDGVFEATDPTGEMFGVDRLKDKLREMRDRSAAEMIDALRRALGDHAHGLRQGDDVTAVVLKRID